MARSATAELAGLQAMVVVVVVSVVVVAVVVVLVVALETPAHILGLCSADVVLCQRCCRKAFCPFHDTAFQHVGRANQGLAQRVVDVKMLVFTCDHSVSQPIRLLPMLR